MVLVPAPVALTHARPRNIHIRKHLAPLKVLPSSLIIPFHNRKGVTVTFLAPAALAHT